jgi:hypothetical protein
MAEELQLTRHGGRRTKGAQTVRQYGSSRSYIIDRLKRENLLALVGAVEAGRVSAYAIAIELGWIRRRPTLGTGSENQATRRRHQLNTLLRESLSK